MNIEFSVREENGVVRIKIISPDKPVVIETATDKSNTVSDLSEKVTSLNREYERIRKAVYRAKKKLAELVVPNTVPGDTWGQGQAVTSYNSTTNTVTHNHVFDKDTDNVIDPTMSDPVMSRKDAGTTSTLSPEPTGNCLPFVPEEASRKFIPLANLPEMYRNIVTAWNDLPLPEKLKGLYPDVAQKLHHLLKEFGEAAVQKATRMVADSPFLLGKSSNSSGWVIYFGWLLKPGNLQKILDNKYRNREQEWGQNYYGATCPEYTPWTDTESCYLDPGFMTEGLTTLNEHTRSCLEQAAKLLGLKKENAA